MYSMLRVCNVVCCNAVLRTAHWWWGATPGAVAQDCPAYMIIQFEVL